MVAIIFPFVNCGVLSRVDLPMPYRVIKKLYNKQTIKLLQIQEKTSTEPDNINAI